jgi:hypothetical protein
VTRPQPERPRPFTGWRRTLALAWLAVVVLLHLAARELGASFLP